MTNALFFLIIFATVEKIVKKLESQAVFHKQQNSTSQYLSIFPPLASSQIINNKLFIALGSPMLTQKYIIDIRIYIFVPYHSSETQTSSKNMQQTGTNTLLPSGLGFSTKSLE